MSTYKTKTVSLLTLNSSQLSWLLAKHICPNDTPVKNPELAVGDFGYQFIERADDDAKLMLLEAMDKFKVSTVWRPWYGESGQWSVWVEEDPFHDNSPGVFDECRELAVVLALVAHLEDAKHSMEVELPEVLL